MRYLNKRPDSPKGRVYSAFMNDGPKKAEAVAQELGVAAKLQRWIKSWTEGDVPSPAPADGEVPSRRLITRRSKAEGKVRYCFEHDPEQEECVILDAGDEQSLVLWLATGQEQFISNTFLVEKGGKHE